MQKNIIGTGDSDGRRFHMTTSKDIAIWESLSLKDSGKNHFISDFNKYTVWLNNYLYSGNWIKLEITAVADNRTPKDFVNR